MMSHSGYSAAAYERGRPDYPRTAVECLIGQLDVGPDDTVLDLAAGTGKLTKELVPAAGTVVAVEPEPAMRRQLERNLPGIAVLDGEAESLPLRDDSVDAVTVAQAFHWFAVTTALEEIARVLRPGGRLGLIWNVRDLSRPIQQELEEVFAAHRSSTPTYLTSRWRKVFESPGPFGPLDDAEFHHSHDVDRESLLALVMSMSYMSRISVAEGAEVERVVGQIFDAHEEPDNPGVVAVPYRTNVFWTESRRRA